MQIMTSGCYSTQRLKSSRLVHLEKMQGLTYVVLDKTDPVNHIWTLSNVRFSADHLVAGVKSAGTEFGERIDRIIGGAGLYVWVQLLGFVF